jgi:hypothetical protein
MAIQKRRIVLSSSEDESSDGAGSDTTLDTESSVAPVAVKRKRTPVAPSPDAQKKRATGRKACTCRLAAIAYTTQSPQDITEKDGNVKSQSSCS